MGKAQIKNGRLPVTQEKTGEMLWLAVAPQLLEAIVAMKQKDTSPFCFLITEHGRPFKTAASFGTWFKKACVASGLPHCTMHGLRKATLRRMANLQMPNKTMKSVSGQRSDKTLERYIEKADKSALADSAVAQLSAWEASLNNAADKAAVND